MAVVGRLTENGELKLAEGIDTRLPLVTDGLVAHYPFDGTIKKYFPINIRYVRDWLNGNSVNTYNHWNEIKVLDYNGVNRASGIIATSNASFANAIVYTDGTVDGSYAGNSTNVLAYAQLDLGAHYPIKEITTWHYYPDGRTYNDTKIEVSEDGIIWYSIFDSAIEGTYQETINGKTISLVSPGYTATPIVTTGTIIADDGVYTEEPITNYLTEGLSGYSALINTNWNGAATTTGNYNGQDYISWDSSLSQYIYTHDFILDDDLATLSEKQITFSLYLRRLEGPATGRIRIYDDVASYRYQNVEVTKEFQKFYMTATLGLNPTRIFVMIDNTGGGTYQWHSAQVEDNNFVTHYVEGTRPNKGQITLPFNLTPPYSINFKHRSTWPFINQVDQPTYPYIMQMGNYYSNASISFWNYGKQLKTYGKGNVSSTWTLLQSYHSYTEVEWDDVEHTYTLVAVSDTVFKVYMDGVYLGQGTSSESITNITTIYLGYGTVANCRYRDFSIYNKVLIDSEVKLLAKGTHSVTNNGLITKSLISRPNIPLDAYYFDLGENGSETITGQLSPTEDTANYTVGDAYVGGNSLEYNFYQSIGLDWNADWSICYFKKPIGTSSGELNLTGFNIDSLGCNSNSVGGGYIWWGKTTGSDALSGTTNATIDPLTYFNDWQVVTLVKSGTTLTIETWINDKIQRTRTVSISGVVPNYYETQYGYDFKLGGWDNNSGCYTHFKNLIVLKRAMTQVELDDFRLAKMRATKDTLNIQNEISTNITL